MKLIQLKRIVDQTLENPYNENLEVCIPNNIPGFGAISTTPVDYVGKGIDWDSGSFHIFPLNEMVEKPITLKKGSIPSREQLLKDAEKYAKKEMGFKISERVDFIEFEQHKLDYVLNVIYNNN